MQACSPKAHDLLTSAAATLSAASWSDCGNKGAYVARIVSGRSPTLAADMDGNARGECEGHGSVAENVQRPGRQAGGLA